MVNHDLHHQENEVVVLRQRLAEGEAPETEAAVSQEVDQAVPLGREVGRDDRGDRWWLMSWIVN